MGAARADGSVVAAVRGRGGGTVVGGRGGSVSSVSPNKGVSYDWFPNLFFKWFSNNNA